MARALELGREYGTDRTAVGAGVGVATNAAIDRADIGTRAAADAVKRLALFVVRENAAAAIVEQQ